MTPIVSAVDRLESFELRDKVMREDIQEALKSAVAEFEKRQQAEQERLREREKFETDWAHTNCCCASRTRRGRGSPEKGRMTV